MNRKAFTTLEYHKIISLLIEYAGSSLGKELCRNLTPSTELEEIRYSQMETSDAQNRVRLKGRLSFSGVVDIRESMKRLEVGSSLNITELLQASSLLTAAARVKAYGRREDAEQAEDTLDAMFAALEPLTPINNEIKRCILSEDEISDDASSGLRHVRRSMRIINERVHGQLNQLLNSYRCYLQEAVITMRDGRYCLPVKAEHKGQVAGMVHDQSSSGSTLFIEPMAVVKLNNDLRQLEIEEQKEIQAVLAELSTQLLPHMDALVNNCQVLSRMDFIFAKAYLSNHYKGSMPIFNTNGYINIKEGRHPLLNPDHVVPINLHLGKDFNLLIVTGPNTGGKTVSLKTVGLFTLMGQAGLHIPAFGGSELAIFQEIFADIGDEQSIEQSLSTFSSHMTNIVKILDQADDQSLCLFDELGAGTDPTEGAALAISILTYLHRMGCRTMATTHYSELKVFALETPGVENACCEFQVETLRPTYRLLIGIPGKSNAFAISKKLGLPEFLIENAKEHLQEQDESFEDLLTHLEENRVTIEKEKQQISEYKMEIEKLKARLSQKEMRLEEQKEKLIKNASEQAQKILRDAKETADQTIRSIQKLAESSGINKELEAQRSKLRDEINKVGKNLELKNSNTGRSAVTPKQLHIGDAVRVLSLNLKGSVLSLPNAKGELMVQMGILNSKVNIKDIELIKESTISGPHTKTGHTGGGSKIKMSKSIHISPEVNLIGMTVDEAIPVLDKYLDDAYLSHLNQVRVVHGRGTGALKSGVHNHLKRLKYVKEFRLGEFGEGDSGVTIVTFK